MTYFGLNERGQEHYPIGHDYTRGLGARVICNCGWRSPWAADGDPVPYLSEHARLFALPTMQELLARRTDQESVFPAAIAAGGRGKQ